MALQVNQQILYPEEYIIEEDLKEMGETNPHTSSSYSLRSVLKQRYLSEGWVVLTNMNLYHALIQNSQHYIVPDVMFIKVALPPEEEQALTSWDANKRPTPAVVFEISSQSTWTNDVRERQHDKPVIYGRIGVKEYFAYDPNEPPVWTKSGGRRLRGWRYERGQPIEIEQDERGWLWSAELESYLEPNGYELRLNDREGRKRLSQEEAALVGRQAAEERLAQESLARQQAEQRASAQELARQEAEQRAAQESAARQQETLARQQAEQRTIQEALARQGAEQHAAQESTARQQEAAARQEAEQRAAEERAARQQAEQHATTQELARQQAEQQAAEERAARQEAEQRTIEVQRQLEEMRRQFEQRPPTKPEP